MMVIGSAWKAARTFICIGFDSLSHYYKKPIDIARHFNASKGTISGIIKKYKMEDEFTG